MALFLANPAIVTTVTQLIRTQYKIIKNAKRNRYQRANE